MTRYKTVTWCRPRGCRCRSNAQLEQKRDIPMVNPHLPLIAALQDETWWADATPEMVETIRLALRDLMKFVDRDKR
jgi:type I restriction enzyme, R subunit